MRFIPTKIHGVLDYLIGLLLIAAPWIFNFADEGAKTWIFVALGIAAIAYSLFTDYEMGVIRKIPFKIHLYLDLISGILLALSPWLFGFANEVYVPHVVFGIIEIAASLMTKQNRWGSNNRATSTTTSLG